jgi:hypothetical protein
MADVAACMSARELVKLPSKPFTIADGLQGVIRRMNVLVAKPL